MNSPCATLPPGASGVSSAARRRISRTSALSAPPAAVKNLSPLRFQGRWLAVIMTAASKGSSPVTVVMNIAGVVQRPRSVTAAPHAASVSQSVLAIASPERRESRPTLTRKLSFPSRARRKRAKPPAMARTAASSSVTASPSTPASATPRTSLPFCSFARSIFRSSRKYFYLLYFTAPERSLQRAFPLFLFAERRDIISF